MNLKPYLLTSIVESKRQDHINVINDRKCNIDMRNLLNYLLIDKVNNSTELYEVLAHKFVSLLRANVKLLILDSIASIYRFSSKEERSPDDKPMIDVISILKRVAHEHNLAVLVINQATTALNTYSAPFLNPRSRVRPALGDLWTKCINSRILLWIDRREGWRDKSRHFQIIFGSNAPTSSPIPFIITKRGIEVRDIITMFRD
ncbi:hypothetical protein BEWA_008580 [Theileria equi strain WA]|uniref:Rad51-like C-terminal domain-containing protein n=1 Tax=Theileria equi strain WA TaxID=1537102 RepID=L0B1U6_THEEQ|nr:hypothetical protein BEWA_008580 [Theileria equi strain WA]AFZ81448.1 hypothetical protein BEWA_008580 [Theileria equi strain WA]|eukprot:XP_004831114.1 hypothetical protein BEWA_008580 [Theileria equi strain WA]